MLFAEKRPEKRGDWNSLGRDNASTPNNQAKTPINQFHAPIEWSFKKNNVKYTAFLIGTRTDVRFRFTVDRYPLY